MPLTGTLASMASSIQKLFALPSPYSDRARIEAVTRLTRLTKAVSIPMMAVSGIFVPVFWGHAPAQWLLGWWAVLLLVYGAQNLHARKFEKRLASLGVPDMAAATSWARKLQVLVTIDGIAWGSLSMLILVIDSRSLEILLLVIAIGYPFTSLFGTSFWPALQYSFMIPVLGLTALALILEGEPGSLGLAAVAGVALLILHSMAQQAHKATMDGIQLQFDKDELVQRLRLQTDAAERASAAKTKFLAAASHDLRQPVHAMTLFADALRMELKGKGADKPLILVNSIERSITSLGHLLDSLLDISKLDAKIVRPDFMRFDLWALIDTLRNEYAPQAQRKGLGFEVHLDPGLAVYSDPGLLDSMLRNLISNALRFTPAGGITLVVRWQEQSVHIEVRDTGIGIPKQHHRDIFGEFVQLANSERDRTKGLGLGLAIVERLAALLDHRIVLESEPGKGSCFTLILAQTPHGLSASPAPEEADQTPRFDATQDLMGLRVLVIDDEIEIRASMAAILEGWGCKPLLADSEAQALVLTALQVPRVVPQVIIADYRLRDEKTGAQAIAGLRREFGKDIPALIITGDTDPERMREAQASGHTLLHKPIRPAKLRAYLWRAAGRSVIASSARPG
jgi:two-component system, sensor histidine kinase